jgi:mono/diheme cytochrome c family protein
MKSSVYFMLITLIYTHSVMALPDWSKDAKLPGNRICENHNGHRVCFRDGNRANIFQLEQDQLSIAQEKGATHALVYPVASTPLMAPYNSLAKMFDPSQNTRMRNFIYRVARRISKFNSFEDIYDWIGLHDFPKTQAQAGPNLIPYLGEVEDDPMGVTKAKRYDETGLTISCAGCHSADLFGVKVLGMANRFPRANEVFRVGKSALSKTPGFLFKAIFKPSKGDYQLFKEAKKALSYVEVKQPQVLGLDTSLAQVGLSLAKRAQDEYATMHPRYRRNPRKNPLERKRADSKPQYWWNLKYKTKWLSDGSIISGNPVHTNFLWNEIGRGADLKQLETWLVKNKKVVRDLTAYVFSTKAPKYNDFFPNEININLAKTGEKLFLQNCSGCHGKYEKGWSDSQLDTYEAKISTTKVWYHEQTPVINVGTDPLRHEGMAYFKDDLNRLKISKTIGTFVVEQDGYIPPPLVGVWARWPYFHNNSVPTLYDVITPDTKRPKNYIAVNAIDKELDFDKEKNGYPRKDLIRAEYRNKSQYYYDTSKAGMSNSGHTKMLLDDNGMEKFSHQDKLAIIEFLKTL